MPKSLESLITSRIEIRIRLLGERTMTFYFRFPKLFTRFGEEYFDVYNISILICIFKMFFDSEYISFKLLAAEDVCLF